MKNKKHNAAVSPEKDNGQPEADAAGDATANNSEPSPPSETAAATKASPETEAASTPAATAEPDDSLLRLRADFDNFRKRTLQEKERIASTAREDMMLQLLPVLDHIELGLAALETHKEDTPFAEGYRILSDQIRGALEKFGLTQIETDGTVFDPNLHEAVSHIPSDNCAEGTIICETRRGYLVGDRLLRASQVVVSSGPAPADTDTPAAVARQDNSEEG